MWMSNSCLYHKMSKQFYFNTSLHGKAMDHYIFRWSIAVCSGWFRHAGRARASVSCTALGMPPRESPRKSPARRRRSVSREGSVHTVHEATAVTLLRQRRVVCLSVLVSLRCEAIGSQQSYKQQEREYGNTLAVGQSKSGRRTCKFNRLCRPCETPVDPRARAASLGRSLSWRWGTLPRRQGATGARCGAIMDFTIPRFYNPQICLRWCFFPWPPDEG